MSVKKVMFYISTLGDGGAQRVVANLANQFSQNGYSVVVVTSFPKENEYATEKAIKRIYLDSENKSGSRIKKNCIWIRRLRKICEEEKPDVLLSFMAEPNYRAILATAFLKTKSIISVRNDPNHEYAGKIGHILGKCYLPFADGCVFQTSEAKRWFPAKLQKKSKVIYNVVDPAFFNTPWKPKAGYAVACGRLTEQKNYKMMIDAIQSVRNKGKYVKLDIFGVGTQENEIKDYIKKSHLEETIVLRGRSDGIATELSNASIFLLSSNYEGMPNALMEAMAMGVPVVSTDCPCGGPRELIQSECGVLCPVGDSRLMAEGIVRILEDEEFSRNCSESEKRRSEMFRSEAVFAEWANYIEAVCTSN